MNSFFRNIMVIGTVVLAAGCRAPEPTQFASVHPGMPKQEVIDLLGPPSSRWSPPPPDADHPVAVWTERWHYGDTLSSTASAALAPDIPPDRVWVISFDAEGQVLETRPPLVNERFDHRSPPPK